MNGMKPLFVGRLILLACAYLCGCADVQERSHIVGGRTGTPLTASVGDTVLRVSREKNLPNIAGKADMFGRTTPTGVETVQYLGVRDGKAFFKRLYGKRGDWRYNHEFHSARNPQYRHHDP